MKPIYLSLLSLQDIYWLMIHPPICLISLLCPVHQIVCSVVTTPPACLLSCDLSMHQPVWLLWPVHQHGCSVVICPQASQSSCYLLASLAALLLHIQQLALSVATCPPACRVSCDLSTSMAAQLWPVNQPALQLWHVHRCACSVVPCSSFWLLSDLAASLSVQLWHVHPTGCSVVTLLCSTYSVPVDVQHTVIIGGLLHAYHIYHMEYCRVHQTTELS